MSSVLTELCAYCITIQNVSWHLIQLCTCLLVSKFAGRYVYIYISVYIYTYNLCESTDNGTDFKVLFKEVYVVRILLQ